MYITNQDKFFYDAADGIGILIDFTTGIYDSLNKVGTAVFERLNNGASVSDIAKQLRELPGCPDDIEQTIEKFVATLLEKQVVIADDTEADCAPFTEDDVIEGFEPVVDEFSDVQDLIMADPVHDVEEDKGWPNVK